MAKILKTDTVTHKYLPKYAYVGAKIINNGNSTLLPMECQSTANFHDFPGTKHFLAFPGIQKWPKNVRIFKYIPGVMGTLETCPYSH